MGDDVEVRDPVLGSGFVHEEDVAVAGVTSEDPSELAEWVFDGRDIVVGYRGGEIEDRLGQHAGHRCRADVFDSEDAIAESVSDALGEMGSDRRPLRMYLNEAHRSTVEPETHGAESIH